jgi:hypothetical protein
MGEMVTLVLGIVWLYRVIRVDCFIEDVRNVVMMKVLQQIHFSWCKEIPMLKAFHMVFRITSKKREGMSTIELGTEVGVQQRQPGYSKKRKVQAVMNRDKNDKMNGDVHVDETLIGGFFLRKKYQSVPGWQNR